MTESLFIRWMVLGGLTIVLSFAAGLKAQTVHNAYKPEPIEVVKDVYAVIGPLGQRSEQNAGLNANYGLIETPSGVILIDSGPSAYAAALLEKAVKQVTNKPIKWVLNTGSQDHRWLGNDYFAQRGAQIHALAATVNTQREYAAQQIEGLKRFVGDQMNGTEPAFAEMTYPEPQASLTIDGVRLEWRTTNAHYPGDTMIYLPDASVVFTGDLVYVDRLLSVLPQSNVREAARAFEVLARLAPTNIVPGHGRVTDLSQAQAQSGDYYQFLIENIGSAAQDMAAMSETLDQFAAPPAFMTLENFDELHRPNMNRVFLDFEANP